MEVSLICFDATGFSYLVATYNAGNRFYGIATLWLAAGSLKHSFLIPKIFREHSEKCCPSICKVIKTYNLRNENAVCLMGM